MLNLIPYPSGTVREKDDCCQIPKVITADLGDFARWAVIAFEKRMKTSVVAGGKWLRLFRDAGKAPEGYSIGITPEGVCIGAADETGVIWALTTLVQLVKDGTLPCCLIQDAPRYGHRGLNLDCARHFFAPEEVKKIIEEISLRKMNVLHWHLSDDQGWRIESRQFPKLNRVSKQYYTQSQIRDIVEFARLRGVEIIPEIDMPGHTLALLSAFPEFGCFGKQVTPAEQGGIYSTILCPGKDSTFDFLEILLGELVTLFPGSRFHIGGDEAPKSEWQKCPDCAQRMQQLGLTDHEDLQGWFTRRMVEILHQYGKTPICWDDALLAETAPGDMQVQYWLAGHRKELECFALDGGKWIYSDMFSCYFDYPYSMTPLEKVYKIVPKPGKQALPNLLGMECCMWTEYVITNERLENRLFPRLHAFSEVCWSGSGDYSGFLKRLEETMKAPLSAGIAFTPPNWWDPNGKARRKEALGFTAAQSAASGDAQEGKPDWKHTIQYMRAFFKPQDWLFYLAAQRKNRMGK